MTGICYSWDLSIFQFQTMHKSSVELGLVYKTFVSKHTWETPLLPRKTNCIHCSRNAGFFRKLNKVIFPSQPKHTSLETFFPSESRAAVQADEAVDGLLSLLLRSMRARAHSSGRNAHIKSSSIVYISKSHDRKNLHNLYEPRSEIFGTEILCYTSKLFFETLSMLSMRIQLFKAHSHQEQ